MVGVRIASHLINIFLLGTSECAAVLGVLTHPHVLPETHHTHTNRQTHGQTKLPIPPTCGVPQVASSYPINICSA